jgi:large subunit ribosomal protein L5
MMTRHRDPARVSRRSTTTTIKAQLANSLGIDNEMQVPKLEKIVINMGVGRATQQPSLLEKAVADLTVIAGQKPIVTKAKNSIAGFKLREGQAIGTKVTLRGDRMWEFLDRLIAVAIPRIRDFRGLPAHSWDGRGNYTFGLNDQTVFPEIDYDKIDVQRGMDITIVTTATTTRAARRCSMRSGSRSRRASTPTRAPSKRKRNRHARGPASPAKKK